MSDDYQRRSYGAVPVGTGEKPGIVVVDFQLGFTDPQYPLGGAPLVSRAVENTETLLKVARTIVSRQSAFLERGDEAMEPLVLREVAEAVEMHESTVSRHLEQSRKELRSRVEEFLRCGGDAGDSQRRFAPMGEAEIALCFQYS